MFNNKIKCIRTVEGFEVFLFFKKKDRNYNQLISRRIPTTQVTNYYTYKNYNI